MACCASKEHIYNYNCIIEGSFSLSVRDVDKYPLITKKSKDFLCFKKAISLIKNKEHLTKKGLLKLVSLKALMGKGLTN